MSTEWGESVFGRTVKRFFIALVILWVIIEALIYFVLGRPPLLTILAISIPVLVVIALLFDGTRDRSKEIWNSQGRNIRHEPAHLDRTLHDAVTAAGLVHAAEGWRVDRMDGSRTLYLANGLNITLVRGHRNWTIIYVGPVNDGTRRDLAALKRVIDTALANSRIE